MVNVDEVEYWIDYALLNCDYLMRNFWLEMTYATLTCEKAKNAGGYLKMELEPI